MGKVKDDNGDIRKDDRLLVSRLIANDNLAWKYVKEDIVDALVRANIKGVRDMLNKHSIDLKSVGGKVYEGLRARDWDALRNFRYECRFRSFLYWRVYDAVQRLVREVVYGDGLDPIPIGPEPGSDGEDGPAIDVPAPENPVEDILIQEAVKVGNRALAQLWSKNPAYALVVLMRNDLGMPAQDVGLLLDRKPNTVDQMNIRAQKELRKIRSSINSGEDVSFYPSSNL